MVRKRIAQSAAEYALFIALAVAAIVWFKVYFMNAYSGYHKKYSDSLGGEQFSTRYSNYTQIKETLPFDTSIQKGMAQTDTDYFSRATTGQDGQVTYTHGGDMGWTTVAGMNYDTTGIKKTLGQVDTMLGDIDKDKIMDLTATRAEIKKLKIDELPADYMASHTTQTVVDDFSTKGLAQDEMYK